MKRVLTTVFLAALLVSTSVAAQRVQVVIDYTKGIYRGVSYERVQKDEEDFNLDKPRYEGRFMAAFDKKFDGVAYFPDSINEEEPILLVEILQVSDKGQVKADVTYADKQAFFNVKGGVFGTFLNLFGDGMGNLGNEVVKWMNKGE